MANLTKGTQIGRAIERLATINTDEQVELAQSPKQIRDKYQAKRDALLGELEPGVRAAVVAATRAMVDSDELSENPTA